MSSYNSSLTDSEWEGIKHLLDYKRKRTNDIRRIADALFYLVKTGCQWRELPREFAAWQTVRYYYDRWRRSGRLDRLVRRLRGVLRRRAKRRTAPSAALIDAQSVKTSLVGGPARGFDGFKKVKGRKRHVVVDTLGLLVAVRVGPANEHETKAAPKLLGTMKKGMYRLRCIWADQGYRGGLVDAVETSFGWRLEIVKRAEKGFAAVPKRWVVERSFAWLEGYRRLSKDYERLPESSEAMIKLAMIRLMLHRIR
ncbi:MAG: IS5 family transposase [Bacteroidota bacterium]